MDTAEIIPKDYSKKILKIIQKNPHLHITELLPPSIFNIELILTNNLKYSDLSSGEKQMISTVQSVLYHLTNLDSVKIKDEKIKYKNFNLIFEEIELYFHPEYQRVFLHRILDGIKSLNLVDSNINLLFVTHSSFILSDIPKQNILFLDIDHETKKSTPQIYEGYNTFSENIYDLLKHSFFLNDFIGEFAKNKFKSLIDFLNSNDLANREWNKGNTISFINLIGDPLIRESLKNHYNEKFNVSGVNIKIQELENEIKRLNKKYGI